MKAKITVEMDNAAFEDSPAGELARILRDLSDKIEEGEDSVRLRDLNGNVVGQFAISD
jgi:hypothetical protein